jgi:subtilase family serine protease
VLAAAALLGWLLLVGAGGSARSVPLPAPHPVVTDWQQLSTSTTPPSQAQCASAGRRCFAPAGIHSAYDLAPLYTRGLTGTGETIAIVDAYGSDTIAQDLHVFDQAFGVQAMCGEASVTCSSGMPSFSQLHLQGTPATVAPPPQSKGTALNDKQHWSLEVSLDVESAHAIAPGANILLVTTPQAETLGVQGFPQMMAAEQYVVDHHLANVITQSFASTEEAFGSSQSIENLRHAFIAAAQNGVTVLGSSGDTGTSNTVKQPVKNPGTVPFPTVNWPASDPLVTGVGGTALCTDPNASSAQPRTVDNADPPAACEAPAAAGQGEIVWHEPSRGIATGGGFSQVFGRPAYQDVLPPGSTAIGSMRGVPDIALQASPRTGVLIYDTLADNGPTGLLCHGVACSAGWYVVGGTSASSPQWAGIVAIADQLNGGGLGPINPALYKLANGPTDAADFNDVIVGNNQVDPSIAGYPATTGWDPSTGLGTPNAANLVPDLVAASH